MERLRRRNLDRPIDRFRPENPHRTRPLKPVTGSAPCHITHSGQYLNIHAPETRVCAIERARGRDARDFMFKYMRRNMQAGYLRNMPTGIGRCLSQVLSSKCSRRYVKHEARRDTLEDEGAPFGADGAGFCRGFRITDETNVCSTIARIRHRTSKIGLAESASYVSHSMNVVQTKQANARLTQKYCSRNENNRYIMDINDRN